MCFITAPYSRYTKCNYLIFSYGTEIKDNFIHIFYTHGRGGVPSDTYKFVCECVTARQDFCTEMAHQGHLHAAVSWLEGRRQQSGMGKIP